jgi:ankyrin repeat protein
MKFLLANGADVEAKDKKGKSTLQLAIDHGQGEAMRVLLEERPDLLKPRTDGRSSHRQPRRGTVRVLVDQLDLSEDKDPYFLALYNAAMEGHIEVVRLLVDKVHGIDARDAESRKPLHVACLFGNFATARLLVEKSSDVNVREMSGETPLRYALFRREKENSGYVQLLLNNGANIEATNDSGSTPLFTAAAFRNKMAMKILVDRGANVTAMNNDGHTALHRRPWLKMPVYYSCCFRVPNIELQDKKGFTPLMLAAKGGKSETVQTRKQMPWLPNITQINGMRCILLRSTATQM